MQGNTELDQYFVPAWAAEAFVQTYYANLVPGRDTVLEPSCGDGRFLMAVPGNVDAYGVEIDPDVADQARANSGRTVITGDFARLDLPWQPSVILGNPPFKATFLDMLLDRAAELLDEGGRMGLLLPVYMFQTASTVMRYNRFFSIHQELVPRTLFQGAQKPLLWANFTRTRSPSLCGFMLYAETQALDAIKREYKTLFVGNQSRASLWGELVETVLLKLGGRATLDEIYTEIENRRPTNNRWWREQIRKVAQTHYQRVGPATYALQAAA